MYKNMESISVNTNSETLLWDILFSNSSVLITLLTTKVFKTNKSKHKEDADAIPQCCISQKIFQLNQLLENIFQKTLQNLM